MDANIALQSSKSASSLLEGMIESAENKSSWRSVHAICDGC
jgi:hypothetical protein